MQQPSHHSDGKLLGIQAARGAAALLVMAFHAERALSLPQYVGRKPLDGISSFGHAGVDFFFVLSGFIILAVHGGDLGRPGRFARYAGRRISRIYPPLWAVMALTLLQVFAGHGWEGMPGWRHLLASLLLVPHGVEPVVGVAWTLEHEMIFYLLFGLAILNLRLGVLVAAAWMGLSLAAPGMLPGPGVLGAYDLLFVIGLGAAWVLRRTTPARSGLIAAVGAAAFLAAGIAEDMGLLPLNGMGPRLAYGLASGAVILGLVGLERQGRLRVGGFMVLLGAASYSIYLIHLMALTLTARALAAAGLVGAMPGWLVMAVACAVAVAAGILFHLVVERPLTRAAQRLATRVLVPRERAAQTA